MSGIIAGFLRIARRPFRAFTLVAALALAISPVVALFAQPAAAAAEAVSLSQCTNGGVGPPLVLDPCSLLTELVSLLSYFI